MTAQLLAGELTTLVQDTKRKAPEIRTAAEKSITDLKALANTSESQLAADLRRRPEFVRPFLLACKSGNPKYAIPAVVSLQRLVAANGLAQERLEELLEALRECSSLGTDVQLRVLQIMPSLFQRYGDQISESRLATALQVCFVLQAAKNAMISHTAAATLQQIVNDVFTRVGTEKALAEVASPETSKMSWQAELDCHQVLQDLCSIAEGKPVETLRKANVSRDFALELIGTILLNHTAVIPRYTNFVDILRQQLLPLMLRVVSSSAHFSQTVRVLRLVPPVVEGFLEVLPTELEMLLSMLTHMLEPDAAITWKRTMCMEAIRDVYKVPSNTRRMYALFDQQPGHKPVVQEQLAMLGRLSTEKPSIIGLGQSSSMPTTTEQNDEDFDGLAALQADPLTATTGVSLTTKVATNSGISVGQSTVKVALIDQLDKTDAPGVPQSYVYALVLSSLNLLCEGLAKFVLPFANMRASKDRKRRGSEHNGRSDSSSGEESTEERLPTNPLDLKGHPDGTQIKAAAGLLESCWPALLSTYSTFFQAALDVEYYHTTIRSFQKLIQVATLLRSATARDAFLTALAKQSLPNDTYGEERRSSVTSTAPHRLSPRNLLCLRALLNLGIALGAVLDDAWSIVLSTLQQADVIVGLISTDRTLSKGGPASIAPTLSISGDLSKEFSSEVAAVRSAASRMLGSASELPPKQYLHFLSFLGAQLRGDVADDAELTTSPRPDHHRRSSSDASNSRTEGLQDLRANVFVIDAFSQLIDLSKARLGTDSPAASGWTSIVSILMRFVRAFNIDPEVRFAAADAVCKSVVASTFTDEPDERLGSLIPFGFATLRVLAETVRGPANKSPEGFDKTGNPEIHNAVLLTVKSCLDQYGESIEEGWKDVCNLVLSVFETQDESRLQSDQSFKYARPMSQKLLRSAFGSLQVICSDLIGSLPHECLPEVLQGVQSCCGQTMDLNVSLTSTSLYQSLSDNIWSGQEHLDLGRSADEVSPRARLWMQLLQAICGSTSSEQTEIRSSAVHACFRILGAVGDKLLPEHWAVCIEHVILKLYELNESTRKPLSVSGQASDKTVSLDETAAAIHTSTCALLEDFLPELLKAEAAASVWDTFARDVNALLDRESLSLTATTFAGLSKVLGTLANDDPSFTGCSASTWKLLLGHKIHEHTRLDRPTSSDNQPALIAFVSCATELYRTSARSCRVVVAPQLLELVADSISESTPISYACDLISTTPLQAECVKLLNYIYAATDPSISQPFLVVLARLVSLSHEKERPDKSARGPTFVAITKDIARLIEQFVRERGASLNLQQEPGMLKCLESLKLLIRHKRSWRREDKVIQVWQQATTSALNALSPLLTLSLERRTTEVGRDIWAAALSILDAILGVGDESDTGDPDFTTNLLFDIDAFNRSYHLLVPHLGSDSRPGSPEACSRFAEVLLQRSLIHDPHPDDSIDPANPSSWPNPQRIGRVRDLDPSRRIKLCYLLVDRLFELVSRAGQSVEHSRLATAAGPYLQLRVELTLKAYISDQPLRGRMPCPLSEKKELIYMLSESVSMDRKAGIADEARKLGRDHRKALTGLAFMALRVTRWDEKIKDALLNLVEASAP